ncbi:energy transducer TonB [Candidatus Zixiibacteriota bacterium]
MASEWRNPRFDIKMQAGTVFEQALSLSLAIVIMLFLTMKTVNVDVYESAYGSEYVSIEDIPVTDQLRVPPAPSRPMIPVPTMDESIPEDVTIMDTALMVDTPMPSMGTPGVSAGTPTGTSSNRTYTAWEEAPELVKMVIPAYPEEAKKRNIEGRVMFQIVVDENGFVVEAIVISAVPPGIFEEAAREAIMQWRYRPAKLRNRPIRVRMNAPVTFSKTSLWP